MFKCFTNTAFSFYEPEEKDCADETNGRIKTFSNPGFGAILKIFPIKRKRLTQPRHNVLRRTMNRDIHVFVTPPNKPSHVVEK
ncbi:hypothetical protein T12_4817 [Trichinella patagoniensis]|uniref:Uncharacterized protein n=1 Tax=Trichinella patagoniensis TaxID=990121 RepID=A0A0V0ZJ40_9BILA|nr:hypothetical protein T12_4817 [Trichinella patagoniensis]